MAWRSAGSLSRSLVSNARVSSLRSAPPLRRLRPPSLSTPRRLFASPRDLKGLLDQHSCVQLNIVGDRRVWMYPEGTSAFGLGKLIRSTSF